MSKYLITGAAGFIGSHLTDSLLTDGHSVIAVDNLVSGSIENLPLDHSQLTYLTTDITTGVPIDQPVDYVCHLASIADPQAYQTRPIETLQVGAIGTEVMLEYAREYDAPFLFTSTSEVYGNPEVHPQSESYNGNVDTYGPRSCYDESKRYGESLCRAYREQHDIPVRVARIFNTYGSRMRDGRAIPTFIRQGVAGDDITVHGDGSQTRSFCYISDMIRGLRKLLQSNLTTPINLGNTDERHILDVATKIQSLTGKDSDVVFRERPEDDPDMRCPDIAKAEHELDWTPTVELDAGLKHTIDWHTN